MKTHFATPADDDRDLCKWCRQPIYVPDRRFPCAFKHIRIRRQRRDGS